MSDPEKPLKPPISNIAPFGLRMQPELRAQLESAAARNERSMNSEITARLNESFNKVCGFAPRDIEELAKKLSEQLTKKQK